METQVKKQIQLVAIVLLAAFSWNVVLADDLNPASYRFDPLSVYAHWEVDPATTALNLTSWSSEDDTDPTTNLFPALPTDVVPPGGGTGIGGKSYEFYLPNWIDELPVKYMRLQLTWQFVPDPPLDILISGVEGTTGVPATLAFTSLITPVGPDTFYQYYDFEFYPNPDQERWTVFLEDNAQLVQVVADTVSTIPEPATMAILGFGGLVLFRKRK